MTAAVSDAVSIPVIASGGAGTFEHFADVFADGPRRRGPGGVDLPFQEHAVADLKRHLARTGASRCR